MILEFILDKSNVKTQFERFSSMIRTSNLKQVHICNLYRNFSNFYLIFEIILDESYVFKLKILFDYNFQS